MLFTMTVVVVTGLRSNTPNYILKWVSFTAYQLNFNLKEVGENPKDSPIAPSFHGNADLSPTLLFTFQKQSTF